MRKKNFTLIELGLIILAILIFALVGLVGMNKDRELGRRVSCLSNLKNLGLTLKQYSFENDDVLPHLNDDAGWEMLRENGYIADCKGFSCPSTKDTGKGKDGKVASSYIYRGGLTENDLADSAVAWDKPNNHYAYGQILFLDGHAYGYSGVNWLDNTK